MTVKDIVNAVKEQKMCGFRYEQSGHHQYRDRMTFYFDGKMFFERFCWGESAGLVYSAWATGFGDDGVINWDKTSIYEGLIPKLPVAVTDVITLDEIEVDKNYYKWPLDAKLKTDKANGYGFFKMLFK